MGKTRSEASQDPMERMQEIMEMLQIDRQQAQADRQQAQIDRQQTDQRIQRLENMMETFMHRDDLGSQRDNHEQSIKRPGQEEESNCDNTSARWRKLEVPVFDGVADAYGWVHKLERFFQIRGVPEEGRLQAVLVALDGKALSWFQWWEGCHPHADWDTFKLAILKRFQVSSTLNPFAALLALKQEDSVAEFVVQFEKFSGMLKDIDETHLMDIFVNGLKEDIGAEIKLYEPTTLSIMVQKVLMIEQKNLAVSKVHPNSTSGSRFSNSYKSPSISRTVTVDTTQKSGGKSYTPSSSYSGSVSVDKPFQRNRPGNYRRLSDADYQEKIRKGECFRCDEKFGPNHVCKNKQFRVMLMEETGDSEPEDDPDCHPETEPVPHLSLNNIVGFTSRRSFKVWGTIEDHKVVVLVDCGATHNFISKALVQELHLKVEDTPSYVVEVGDGHKISCKGVCKDVSLLLHNVPVNQQFYLFGLGGVDIVLGLEWLASLGDIRANFEQLTLRFTMNGQKLSLQGDPELCKKDASLNSLLKALQHGEGFLIDFQQIRAETDWRANVPADLVSILHQFPSIFEPPEGLPPHRRQDHAIHLKEGAQIPNLRPYRYPHYQKNEIEKLVAKMLDAGIIRPSTSPFSSPIILVRKKDGSWRFCVDYRALNKITVPDKFPIPVIDELLDEIGGARIFSKLDLRSGYHQIRMKEGDIEKTAFRTHEGHYEFLVLPFGLTNAPSSFQSLMNEVLRPLLRKFVLVFFDDILIYSLSMEDHIQHLHTVLSLLQQHDLKVNGKKCTFGQETLEYLGHIISAGGVSADPKKLEAMWLWPTPKDIKSLRGFLGLTGYYRRFVQNYGKIAKPLTNLLKKDAFQWSSDAHAAFEQLKNAMTTLPMLAVPDFTKPFVLETDASGTGLGAVLLQEGRPLAFWSTTLSDRNQRKSVYDRELMAVVKVVQKWRHYLLGHHFIIRTDQKSLKFLADQRMLGEEQFKWVSKLAGFDFDIQYKPGKDNSAADALSRRSSYCAISILQIHDFEEWVEEVNKDDKLQKIIQDLILDPTSHSGYVLRDQKLFFKGRLVLSKTSSRIPVILKEFHSSLMGGHSGIFRTYKRVANLVYWDGMKSDIKNYVAACDVCQRNKSDTLTPAGLLQPLPVPTQVWTDISMDFVTGLPKSMGKDTILVVVDRLTKYAHFLARKKKNFRSGTTMGGGAATTVAMETAEQPKQQGERGNTNLADG
ncbi:uncharacterized protein LOC130718278 [Lotus japonicus]|uniref:uncharacterized protein LOC130718278 n=1 Tax=Lotus japonicus TaxID=34305 RepID=UPI00258AD474|nr:uncharacterized protein LOC130718278 [Lotus japonicus]